MHLQGRIGELRAIAAIQLAAPQGVVGISYVGEPLSIAGEVQFAGRNPSEIGQKLTRIMIVALQLKPQLLSHYEQLLAIVAGNGREKGQRPGCQLLRSIAAPAQQRTRFRQRPDVMAAAPRAFKKEILAIARPVSAALLRRLVPSRWKYRTKALAVGLHFPQRGNVFLGILQREADATAVEIGRASCRERVEF